MHLKFACMHMARTHMPAAQKGGGEEGEGGEWGIGGGEGEG